MSFWQFMAAVNGYVAANSPDDKTLDDDDINSIGEMLDQWQPNSNG